jgi:hypothetical protein
MKQVSKINKKTSQKVGYNSKLTFLKLNMAREMAYYSSSLKSLQGI